MLYPRTFLGGRSPARAWESRPPVVGVAEVACSLCGATWVVCGAPQVCRTAPWAMRRGDW